MTLWTTLIYTLFLALVFAFIFSARRDRGPWSNFWIFLLVLFLGMWAVGLWFSPAGPVWYGVAWLDLLLVGGVLAILLGGTGKGDGRWVKSDEEGEVDLVAESKREPGAIRLAVLLFWLFVAGLVVSIIVGLVRRGYLV